MNLKKEEETTLFFPANFKINMYLRESVHFSVFTLQTIDFIVRFFISRHWVLIKRKERTEHIDKLLGNSSSPLNSHREGGEGGRYMYL